ncbi:hypothetical protein AB0P17_17430 [Streptomyces sp. NPDC088124]|uniref:hypothetical protein n=1 Tax=Streptomyces sp. NPDC088124 TaxID=3154654 RepID=UPI00343CB37F
MDLGEYRCGPVESVRGTVLTTVVGDRPVLIGPDHPYVTQGLPMDFPSVGHGQNEFFAFRARAFLDRIAGPDGLPPCPPLAHGLHHLRILDAVVAAAHADGRSVTVA